MSEVTVPDRDCLQAGVRLREARERLGLSLEDAARTTRISKAYLKAIEEGAYDKLPSEAYAKGFRRSYAQYLGLSDEEALIQHVNYSVSCPNCESDDEYPKTPCCSAFFPPARTVWEAVLPFMVLLGIVALSAVFFIPSKRSHEPQTVKLTSTPVQQKTETASKQKEAVLSQFETSAPIDQAKQEPLPAVRLDAKEDGLVLKLKAIEDVSLDATIDNSVSQHYDLKAGDNIEWKGDRIIVLDLENAGGVEAQLNGKTLKPFGEIGAPAHAVLTPAERLE